MPNEKDEKIDVPLEDFACMLVDADQYKFDTARLHATVAPCLQSKWRWRGMHTKYLRVDVLGVGIRGAVYRSTCRSSGREVAVKFVPAGGIGEILPEVAILPMLQHRNIVTVLEVLRHKHQFYIVMECIPCSLKTYLGNKYYGFPIEDVRMLARQLFEALAYLHDCQLAHRDLKPDNILVTPTLGLKVCDFGYCARLRDS